MADDVRLNALHNAIVSHGTLGIHAVLDAARNYEKFLRGEETAPLPSMADQAPPKVKVKESRTPWRASKSQ
jgi:hypothetical protein